MQSLPKIITPKGYTIRKDFLSPEKIKEVCQELTMTPKTALRTAARGGGPPPFPIYMESNSRLYLPRAWALSKFGPPDADIVAAGAPLPSTVSFVGSPYDYQIKIIETFIGAGANGLLCVPCGKGKTFMAINIAVRLGRRFLIVVDKEFLLNQWRGEIERFAPALRVGILQADRVQVSTADYDCTICMIQTLCSRDYPESFFADYGFTIFDECHHLGAAHFSRALQKIQTKYLLGLSATPTREDGMTQVFEAFLGKPVYWEKRREADPTVMVRAITYHDFADTEWADVPTDYAGDVVLARLLSKIVESPARTALIVRLLVELCAEGTRQILVLSERRVLLEAVEAALPPTIKQGYYIGGMKDAIRERNAKEAQVLLATYSMASDALNIKSLNCVILASPRKRVEQSTGRILRQRPEERTLAPLIVDIVDIHDTYKNMYRKRAEYYKQCGYQISIEKTIADGKIQVVRSARPAAAAVAEEAENEIRQSRTAADGDECVIKI
jgi:superfamily II DNA or RNA helicase